MYVFVDVCVNVSVLVHSSVCMLTWLYAQHYCGKHKSFNYMVSLFNKFNGVGTILYRWLSFNFDVIDNDLFNWILSDTAQCMYLYQSNLI